MTENQGPAHKKDLTRRRVILASGAAVAAAGIGAGVVATASAGEEKSTGGKKAGQGEACYRLTSETTEGPYYIDADKIRKDITEDKEGIPMTLRLKVIDSDTCKPLKRAAVDIWHCDALGIYSGYESMSQGGPGGGTPPSGAPTDMPTDAPTGTPTGTPPSGGPGGGGGGHSEPTDDERYLRGTQLTDKHGYVEFTTIFPGWYQGRAVHIHTKVHVGGKMTDAGYEGGHTCHTGQFFFAESAVLDSARTAPYSTSTTTRTTLTEDTIYDQSGVTGGLLKLTYGKGRMARGVAGSITMGVDPDETNDGTSL
ncbi:intradiol ring-cleavage dioxygenase [Streptomyces sp. NBC_01102]|uniref:intradiol ring-cleavage dioxygenase n=1 Tax=unclassified Streptomyces TaxID=2593676 RepID=UPI0038655FB5|nr:intradiol ring-cleavage dioxygenase [Streptomyces sp. NBC_01102]